jgi:hypothetical protein
LLIFKLAVFRLPHARVHGGAHLNNEKVVTSARVDKKARLFFSHNYLLTSHLMSNHGVPMGNPHISVLVTKSAFTYTRKVFTPVVQGIKNAHLQQANASVCG